MPKRRIQPLSLPFLLLFLAVAVCARAEDVLTVSPSWQGFTSADGQGLYHDLVRAVFESRGDTVRHQEVPAKRGLIMVREGQADMYMCDTEIFNGLQLGGVPMYEGEFHALFLTDEFPKWNGVQSLKNRRLVWRLGYYTPADFPVPVKFHETRTGSDALTRVLRGTADFYIDDANLIRETIDALVYELDTDLYRIESVGFRQYFPVFAVSERGRKLRETFEKGMLDLAGQGRLRPIYDKWNLPMPRAFQP
jgi:hypothetical protein